MLVLYFHLTRKVSTDEFQYHDHNRNYQISYRSLIGLNDNIDLLQKQSHKLLENISKVQREITKKDLKN